MILAKLYDCNTYADIKLPGKKSNHGMALILKDLGIIDLITDII